VEDLREHTEFVSPLIDSVCWVNSLLMMLALWWLLQRFSESGGSLFIGGLCGCLVSRVGLYMQFGFNPIVKSGFWGYLCLFWFVLIDRRGMVLGIVMLTW